MPFDPATHHRRSIRRPGFDYSAVDGYFITICAHNRSCLFGRVEEGQMVLNDAGHMILRTWEALADPQDGIELDEYILMPNHFHGIVFLHSEGLSPKGVLVHGDPVPAGTMPRTIGRILQGFKSLTTHSYIQGVHQSGWPRFNGHLWQRDYFDHLIRNEWSLERIQEYIRTNAERWERDDENPLGSGGDSVREWVKALTTEQAKKSEPTSANSVGGLGEHKVRPYGALDRTGGEGRTQGSPLRGVDRAGGGGRTPDSPVRDVDRASDEGRTQGSPLPGISGGQAPPIRVGHGYDLHRLQSGGRLMLGGVEVSSDISPVAHSDGDVVLHAIVDALLGAMGWGDIGEHFSNTDARWKDAPSRVFVDEVFARVLKAGYVLGNVDVTILAERPKLKAFKPAIAVMVAELLQTDVTRVNVKAGTNEGCDAIGRGEAIAAHAVVLLVAGE